MTYEELESTFEEIKQKEADDPTIDRTVLKLNVRIQQTLTEYFPDSDSINFRFDLPEKKPESRTISIFLYNIQEDLQMRRGEARNYNPRTQTLQPGWVHLRCCYLITYWQESATAYTNMPWNGEPNKGMNRVLNALLNERTFEGLPNAYTRVIPPSEELTSLGNFWQALEDKPRLCLSYMVTIPVRLTRPIEKNPPIITLSSTFQPHSPKVFEIISKNVRAAIQQAVGAMPDFNENVRQQLDTLRIICTPSKSSSRKNLAVEIHISGILTKNKFKEAIKKELDRQKKKTTLLPENINGELEITAYDICALKTLGN